MGSKTSLARALAVVLASGVLLQCGPTAEAPAAGGASEGADATISAFAKLWARRLEAYTDSRFLGVETRQNPTDAWAT